MTLSAVNYSTCADFSYVDLHMFRLIKLATLCAAVFFIQIPSNECQIINSTSLIFFSILSKESQKETKIAKESQKNQTEFRWKTAEMQRCFNDTNRTSAIFYN